MSLEWGRIKASLNMETGQYIQSLKGRWLMGIVT